MAPQTPSDNTVCRNKKAAHRFQVLEKLECGIALVGTEVKSLREHGASLEEAYARVQGDELWLIGFHIAPYRFGNLLNHEPLRKRKLLARSREISHLKAKTEQKGLNLIPLRVYFNDRGIAKVTVGVARSMNTADKRDSLKEREHRQEIERAMRRRR
jgi:SsrA-binding protein